MITIVKVNNEYVVYMNNGEYEAFVGSVPIEDVLEVDGPIIACTNTIYPNIK